MIGPILARAAPPQIEARAGLDHYHMGVTLRDCQAKDLRSGSV